MCIDAAYHAMIFGRHERRDSTSTAVQYSSINSTRGVEMTFDSIIFVYCDHLISYAAPALSNTAFTKSLQAVGTMPVIVTTMASQEHSAVRSRRVDQNVDCLAHSRAGIGIHAVINRYHFLADAEPPRGGLCVRARPCTKPS